MVDDLLHAEDKAASRVQDAQVREANRHLDIGRAGVEGAVSGSHHVLRGWRLHFSRSQLNWGLLSHFRPFWTQSDSDVKILKFPWEGVWTEVTEMEPFLRTDQSGSTALGPQ